MGGWDKMLLLCNGRQIPLPGYQSFKQAMQAKPMLTGATVTITTRSSCTRMRTMQWTSKANANRGKGRYHHEVIMHAPALHAMDADHAFHLTLTMINS